MMFAGTPVCNVHGFELQLLQSTVVEVVADPPLEVAAKKAVFVYLPQELVVVLLTTWALALVLLASVVGL
jgi:hypothetical protein